MENLTISNEVIATVSSIAATSVDGVAGMSSSLIGDIAGLLSKKSLSKGVKVNIMNESVEVDLFIIVDHGVHIPDVASAIQQSVKEEIENMTPLTVLNINVHVDGIALKSA